MNATRRAQQRSERAEPALHDARALVGRLLPSDSGNFATLRMSAPGTHSGRRVATCLSVRSCSLRHLQRLAKGGREGLSAPCPGSHQLLPKQASDKLRSPPIRLVVSPARLAMAAMLGSKVALAGPQLPTRKTVRARATPAQAVRAQAGSEEDAAVETRRGFIAAAAMAFASLPGEHSSLVVAIVCAKEAVPLAIVNAARANGSGARHAQPLSPPNDAGACPNCFQLWSRPRTLPLPPRPSRSRCALIWADPMRTRPFCKHECQLGDMHC